VDLQLGHRQALVDEEAFVVDKVERLEVEHHLRDDALVPGPGPRVVLRPVCARLRHVRQHLVGTGRRDETEGWNKGGRRYEK